MGALIIASCNNSDDKSATIETKNDSTQSYAGKRLAGYATVRLTADLSSLSENEKKMLPLLIQAADIMNELYWQQCYGGNKDSLLNAVTDADTKAFININYGPWDKLNSDTPFVTGVGKKPEGAGFYPADMTKDELDRSSVADKHGHYSIVRRDSAGKLYSIPYHVAYKEPLEKAAGLLKQAASFADDPGLKKYLLARAETLVNDNYNASDAVWLDMKNNSIDIVIGAIEDYEDGLYNYRNAYQAYVLIKDKEWSQRLAKYVAMLPELQEGIPVDAKYKTEKPGTSSDLNAYNIVYYAGQCNSGGKSTQ